MIKKILAVVLLLGVAGAGYYFFGRGEPDWRQLALDDVDFIYHALLEGHPGATDPDNPNFLETLEASYAVARERAEMVTTSAGHFYVKRGFTNAFQDMHLVEQSFAALRRDRHWPGFAVQLNDQGRIAIFMREIDDAPPLGAELVSCDGLSTDELYEQRLVPFYFGAWLSANRRSTIPYLLIDNAIPFADLPTSCVFSHEGGSITHQLNWLPASDRLIASITDASDQDTDQVTALRFLDDGTAWISIASFSDSDPSVAREISALIEAIEADMNRIANAPALVVDVRGNLGGATDAGIRIASAIWGADFVEDHRPRFASTAWRASEFNLEQLGIILPQIARGVGEDSPIYEQVLEVQSGMEAAVAQGDEYFVQPQPERRASDAAPADLPDAVYFLTDQICISACLDFADLLLSIPGVTQVGHETGGDTQYLEVVFADLPSGRGRLAYPAAIHRGRTRGPNETYVPALEWPGDISDTAALEGWISGLPAAQ